MSFITSIANSVTKRLPEFLPPKGHALADMAVTGGFLLAGLAYSHRNKRAALAAFAGGGTHLLMSLLTAYDSHQNKPISLRLHREMEIGIAAMIAAMPGFLQFEEDREKRFFLLQGAAITALANVSATTEPRRKRVVQRAA